VIAADASGVIHLSNRPAERQLGTAAEEAVGSTLALIIPPELGPTRIARFHLVMVTTPTDMAPNPAVVAATAGQRMANLEMTLGLDEGDQPTGPVAVLPLAGDRRLIVSYAPTGASS
jgi:hypothetical protein